MKKANPFTGKLPFCSPFPKQSYPTINFLPSISLLLLGGRRKISKWFRILQGERRGFFGRLEFCPSSQKRADGLENKFGKSREGMGYKMVANESPNLEQSTLTDTARFPFPRYKYKQIPPIYYPLAVRFISLVSLSLISIHIQSIRRPPSLFFLIQSSLLYVVPHWRKKWCTFTIGIFQSPFIVFRNTW